MQEERHGFEWQDARVMWKKLRRFLPFGPTDQNRSDPAPVRSLNSDDPALEIRPWNDAYVLSRALDGASIQDAIDTNRAAVAGLLDLEGTTHFDVPEADHVGHRVGVVGTFDIQRFADLARQQAVRLHLMWRYAGAWHVRWLGDELSEPDLVVLRTVKRLRVGEFRHLGADIVVGLDEATAIERWEPETFNGTELARSPGRNSIYHVAPVEEAGGVPQLRLELSGGEPMPLIDEVDAEIDVVYTWVDAEDEQWRQLYRQHAPARDTVGTAERRFRQMDELKYSLRSLHLYCPFVRTVHLVTAGHLPAWLRVEHPQLNVVSHQSLFRSDEALPTFNSHAIEACLHHIEGLSERYLYLNDDVFFGRFQTASNYFHANGLAKFFWGRPQVPVPGLPDLEMIDEIAANARDLLARRFGRQATRKFQHTPHPQLKSINSKLEQEFAEEWHRVVHTRFRSASDISFAVSLHHHYAYLVGHAVPGELDYRYIDVGPQAGAELASFRAGEADVFCLNDTARDDDTWAAARPAVEEFLQRSFPDASPFER